MVNDAVCAESASREDEEEAGVTHRTSHIVTPHPMDSRNCIAERRLRCGPDFGQFADMNITGLLLYWYRTTPTGTDALTGS